MVADRQTDTDTQTKPRYARAPMVNNHLCSNLHREHALYTFFFKFKFYISYYDYLLKFIISKNSFICST